MWWRPTLALCLPHCSGYWLHMISNHVVRLNYSSSYLVLSVCVHVYVGIRVYGFLTLWPAACFLLVHLLPNVEESQSFLDNVLLFMIKWMNWRELTSNLPYNFSCFLDTTWWRSQSAFSQISFIIFFLHISEKYQGILMWKSKNDPRTTSVSKTTRFLQDVSQQTTSWQVPYQYWN